MDILEQHEEVRYCGEAKYTWRDYARVWWLTLKPARWNTWFSLLVWLIAPPVFLVFTRGETWFAWLFIAFWGLSIWSSLINPLQTMWSMARKKDAALYRIGLDDTSVHTSSEDFAAQMGWNHFTSFQGNDEVILLYRGSDMQVWLVRRMFNDDWPRVQQLVARQLGKCGRCGYLLRGLRSDACPECGTPLAQAQPVTPVPD